MKKVRLQAFPSIELAVHGHGQYRVINTVQQAAETLLERWPKQEGMAFVKAIQTCSDALEGRQPPIRVREALIEAAEDAKIGLRE